MSAVAAIVTNKEALLFSDGLKVNLSGLRVYEGMKIPHGRILDTAYKKIGKVNDHIGVMMTGVVCYRMRDVLGFVSSKGSETPKEVSEALVDFLELAMSESPDFRTQLMDRSTWISVIGYEKGEPCNYVVKAGPRSGSTINRNTPPKPYITFQCPQADNHERLFQQLLNRYGTNGEVLKEAGLIAFTSLVRDLESKCHTVGGQIFRETILNPCQK